MSSTAARKRLAAMLVVLSITGAGCAQEREDSRPANEQPQADLQQTVSGIQLAIAEKNYGDAASLAKAAQAAFPTAAEVHLLAAQAEGYLGNSGNAATAFQRAVDNGLAEPRSALADPAFESVRTSDAFARIRSNYSPVVANGATRAPVVARERIRAGDVEIVEDETGSYVRAGDVVLDLNK